MIGLVLGICWGETNSLRSVTIAISVKMVLWKLWSVYSLTVLLQSLDGCSFVYYGMKTQIYITRSILLGSNLIRLSSWRYYGTIWNERKDYIFNHKPPSFALWKSSFKTEVRDHFIRIKRELHCPINRWLDTL
jgi:hypothetical protein